MTLCQCAELVADLLERGEPLEADGLVQTYACRVRVGDACEGAVVAERSERLQQSGVERPADASALMLRVDIDARLDRPLVGRGYPVRAGVGVAGHDAVALANDPRQSCGRRADAAAVLLGGRRAVGEANGGAGRVGRVDRRYLFGVIFVDEAEDAGGHHASRTAATPMRNTSMVRSMSSSEWQTPTYSLPGDLRMPLSSSVLSKMRLSVLSTSVER